MFCSLAALKFHNRKDLHAAMNGNGLWRIVACWERDNKVFVAQCSINKYLSLDVSPRQQTAVINFLNSVQISVLWHLAMLESLMSLESTRHFHDWSFFTRLWPFYLVSCSDKGSVYSLICTLCAGINFMRRNNWTKFLLRNKLLTLLLLTNEQDAGSLTDFLKLAE